MHFYNKRNIINKLWYKKSSCTAYPHRFYFNSPYDGGTAYAADGDVDDVDDDAPCGDDAPCDGDDAPCGDVGGDDVAYGKAQVAFRKVYESHNIHSRQIQCKGNDTDDQLYVY